MLPDPDLHAHLVKILEKSEIFEEIDRVFRFTKTIVVYQAEDEVYHGHVSERLSSISEDSIRDAQNVVRIAKTA